MGFLADGGGSTGSRAARPRRLPTWCCKAREAARRRREGRDRSAGGATLVEGGGRRADCTPLVVAADALQADVGGSPRSWLDRRWWRGRLETTPRWSDPGRGAARGDRGGEVALDGGRRPEEHSAVALRW
ncbi:collagen alpha-1(I) chain-like [Iris pallida]|uniref:Collagen alpha-1(I) chain-like n=1 Tax=Iris pallida TaxID=29817 RepID=A0AAX6F2Q9_IRIPA|nr:collagen alpha-1(I) chain-like [Iris pallida]